MSATVNGELVNGGLLGAISDPAWMAELTRAREHAAQADAARIASDGRLAVAQTTMLEALEAVLAEELKSECEDHSAETKRQYALDIRRFQALVRRGRIALSAGRPEPSPRSARDRGGGGKPPALRSLIRMASAIAICTSSPGPNPCDDVLVRAALSWIRKRHAEANAEAKHNAEANAEARDEAHNAAHRRFPTTPPTPQEHSHEQTRARRWTLQQQRVRHSPRPQRRRGRQSRAAPEGHQRPRRRAGTWQFSAFSEEKTAPSVLPLIFCELGSRDSAGIRS